MARFEALSAEGNNGGGLVLAGDRFTVCRLSGKSCLPGSPGRLGATVIFISSVRGMHDSGRISERPVKNTNWGRKGKVTGPESAGPQPPVSLALRG
ncbi:MAG TPA: hypothetical protein VKM93_23545 [Terriglobia bacterium]|nr:hypothetical protein [Terriglobia bacterium]